MTTFSTTTRNKHSPMNFNGGSFEGIVNFYCLYDTRCMTFTFHTFAQIQGHATTIFGKYLFGRRFEI